VLHSCLRSRDPSPAAVDSCRRPLAAALMLHPCMQCTAMWWTFACELGSTQRAYAPSPRIPADTRGTARRSSSAR
jgi:hypothetical protein